MRTNWTVMFTPLANANDVNQKVVVGGGEVAKFGKAVAMLEKRLYLLNMVRDQE